MSITIGKYTISPVFSGDCDYFIQHEDGEGMCVSSEQLMQMFDGLFKEHM
jgi:hypothetical protein